MLAAVTSDRRDLTMHSCIVRHYTLHYRCCYYMLELNDKLMNSISRL